MASDAKTSPIIRASVVPSSQPTLDEVITYTVVLDAITPSPSIGLRSCTPHACTSAVASSAAKLSCLVQAIIKALIADDLLIGREFQTVSGRRFVGGELVW